MQNGSSVVCLRYPYQSPTFATKTRQPSSRLASVARHIEVLQHTFRYAQSGSTYTFFTRYAQAKSKYCRPHTSVNFTCQLSRSRSQVYSFCAGKGPRDRPRKDARLRLYTCTRDPMGPGSPQNYLTANILERAKMIPAIPDCTGGRTGPHHMQDSPVHLHMATYDAHSRSTNRKFIGSPRVQA